MAATTGAFISADQIVCSWLINHEKTIHTYYKIIKLVADCVRELSLTTLPMVNHAILKRPWDQGWFTLPGDYVDYCALGIRQGEFWRPIGVNDQLMPMPNNVGNGEFDGDEFGNAFNTQGDWTNWLNPKGNVQPASFNPDDFNSPDFNITGNTIPNPNGLSGNFIGDYPYGLGGYTTGIPFFWSETYDYYGENKGRAFGLGDGFRPDVVTVNPKDGVIMCPQSFPSCFLYLSYIATGTVDTMTQIDIRAQATIEAYVTWKYWDHKRNGKQEAAIAKQEYDMQHRILRSRIAHLSTTDVRRIVMEYYGQTQRIG